MDSKRQREVISTHIPMYTASQISYHGSNVYQVYGLLIFWILISRYNPPSWNIFLSPCYDVITRQWLITAGTCSDIYAILVDVAGRCFGDLLNVHSTVRTRNNGRPLQLVRWYNLLLQVHGPFCTEDLRGDKNYPNISKISKYFMQFVYYKHLVLSSTCKWALVVV